MREEGGLSETRTKASKFRNQNQIPKTANSKTRTSWSSNIVKGFSADKKPSSHSTIPKKIPLASSGLANQKNPFVPSHSRVKRSLIGDLSCSVNGTRVHPHVYQNAKAKSLGSRDLFLELDHLSAQLRDSKEREFKLEERVKLLEAENTSLLERLEASERQEEGLKRKESSDVLAFSPAQKSLEVEVVELRRLNKELQLQKRSLACRLSSMDSQLATLAMASEINTEASFLRHTSEDLCKQVEGLQMSRLNEVEELAYLRWANSCLRKELCNACLNTNSSKLFSPNSGTRNCESGSSMSSQRELIESSSAKIFNMIKKLKKWSITGQDSQNLDRQNIFWDRNWVDSVERRSPQRRHSISGSKCRIEEMQLNKRRQSDGFLNSKQLEKKAGTLPSPKYEIHRSQLLGNCHQSNKIMVCSDFEKRALRIPNPPPKPSCSVRRGSREEGPPHVSIPPPPPPPPPLPPKFYMKSTTGSVQRAPQVVEFYHALMKRDSRKDSSSGGLSDTPCVAHVHSNMIGEIENRSSHLLAIKEDVETQGEFVKSLIREVNSAVYQNIADVVAFVKWLDDELGFLVDERAVLKHFDWPEKKADTLREAAFGYSDLKKLESEVSYYKDDPQIPCDIALKKMVALSEKMERTVYNLLRTRDSLITNYKEFQIPTDWMLDNGIISKIKVSSIRLAKKYMKRVAMELQSRSALEKDPAVDYMLLQGVRFAFRIHQFAGGLDADTMHAFEELRNLAQLNKP